MTESKQWSKQREPFSEIEEWETENGTKVRVGDTVLAKPTYIDRRLPAEVVRIYWDPQGLPGGKFDHRGKAISTDTDSGEVEYQYPDRYDCILTVRVKFKPEEGTEYDHMAGKELKIEGYNLDFVIGNAPEIKRDRSNCNA